MGHIGKWQFKTKNARHLFHHWAPFEGQHVYPAAGSAPEEGEVRAADMAADKMIEFLQQRAPDTPFAVTVAFYPPKAVGVGTEPGEQWKPARHFRALYDNETIPEPYVNMTMEESFLKLHRLYEPE